MLKDNGHPQPPLILPCRQVLRCKQPVQRAAPPELPDEGIKDPLIFY